MTTHPSILDCKIPWSEEPGRLQSLGPQRVRHNRVIKQQHPFSEPLVLIPHNLPDFLLTWKFRPFLWLNAWACSSRRQGCSSHEEALRWRDSVSSRVPARHLEHRWALSHCPDSSVIGVFLWDMLETQFPSFLLKNKVQAPRGLAWERSQQQFLQHKKKERNI